MPLSVKADSVSSSVMLETLTKETNHTIHLEPDGTVTWTVLERDVRSDGGHDGARSREEAEYFSAASEGRFPVSLALASLDPISVRLGILRAVPPYALFTDARFARLDSLMARLIEKFGMSGTSTLERHSGTITWTLTVDDVGKPAGSEGSDEGIETLLDGFGKTCRWVLVEGHFVDAVGFDLSRITASLHRMIQT
jgi:hypothetical protein